MHAIILLSFAICSSTTCARSVDMTLQTKPRSFVANVSDCESSCAVVGEIGMEWNGNFILSAGMLHPPNFHADT